MRVFTKTAFPKSTIFVLIKLLHSAQLKNDARGDLAKNYAAIRAHTETLCAPLQTEDFLPQPADFVSPPKWNIAHTTWFFEEMILKRFSKNYKEFNPQFSFLFNSYYNSVGTRTVRDNRGDLSRPTVKEVFEYRKFVDEKMVKFLQRDLIE